MWVWDEGEYDPDDDKNREKTDDPDDGEGPYLWTAEDDACDECQDLDGEIFDEMPERPHPNCNCDISKYTNEDEEDEDKEPEKSIKKPKKSKPNDKNGKKSKKHKQNIDKRDEVLKQLNEGSKTHGDRKMPKDQDKAGGYCGRKVGDALKKAFPDLERPKQAKDYGKPLEDKGFNHIPEDKNYMPNKGDLKVYQAIKNHPDGHIQMYDGEKWVSDYNQNTPGGL